MQEKNIKKINTIARTSDRLVIDSLIAVNIIFKPF